MYGQSGFLFLFLFGGGGAMYVWWGGLEFFPYLLYNYYLTETMYIMWMWLQ